MALHLSCLNLPQTRREEREGAAFDRSSDMSTLDMLDDCKWRPRPSIAAPLTSKSPSAVLASRAHCRPRPRTPRRVRPLLVPPPRSYPCFHPRTRVGCNLDGVDGRDDVGVSTHAPRVGCDTTSPNSCSSSMEFLPTHPRRVRLPNHPPREASAQDSIRFSRYASASCSTAI